MCLSKDRSGSTSSPNNSSSSITSPRPLGARDTESPPPRRVADLTERLLRAPSITSSSMESVTSKPNQNGTPTSPTRDRYSDRAPPDYNRRSSSPPSSLSARSPPPHLPGSHIPGLPSSHHSSLATSLSSSMLGMLPSALQAAAGAAAAQGLSSPRTSPPTLVPSAMSMASMASMLGHPGAHNAFLHPGYGRQDFPNPRDVDFASNMSKFMDRSFGDSPPPPTVPTNDPMANECKIVDYRGEKVAAFVIQNRTMLCLPQVFELFLKHLVGGLHTVYTKLKRLEITPIVCNVEQVRILRGLGAIQPGVNRCKLLADSDFDALYKDCTTTRLSSRPGRPPKRGVPFPPMSPQDAMLHLKNSMHVNGGPGGAGGPVGGPGTPTDPYKDAPYAKEPRLDKSPFGNGFAPPPPGLNPMAAQFMALNHPAALNAQAAQQAAQAAHAAFLSQTGAIPHFPGLPAASSSPSLLPGGGRSSSAEAAAAAQFMKTPGLTSLEALQRSGLLGAAYFERMREGQKNLQEAQDQERRKRDSSHDSITKDDRTDSPVLNLSKPTNDTSELSGSEGGRYPDDDVLSGDDDVLSGDDGRRITGFSHKDTHHKDKANNNNKTETERSRQYSGSVNSDATDKTRRDTNASTAALTSGLLAGFPNLLANAGKEGSNGDAKEAQLNNVYGLIGNIQALLKAAVDTSNTKDGKEKGDPKTLDSSANDTPNKDTPPIKEKKGTSEDIHKEIDELRRNTQIYFRRFKKEKRYRRKLQEQLEQETRRRVQMEEALRVTSADTLKRITESLAKEMEHQKRIRSEQDETGSGSGAGDHPPKDIDDRDNTPDIVSLEEKRSSGGSGTGGALDDDLDRQSSPASVSSSNKQYNASSGGTNNRGSESGTTNSDVTPDRPLGSSNGSSGVPSRDTPTLGFAKNLFPFNGSSLFTSAN